MRRIEAGLEQNLNEASDSLMYYMPVRHNFVLWYCVICTGNYGSMATFITRIRLSQWGRS